MSAPSPKVAAQTARLAAVQTVYQFLMNKQPVSESIRVYMDEYAGMDIDGENLVMPDKALFSAIVQGVESRFTDLETVLDGQYSREDKALESLLKAIALCGIYELMAHQDTDPPIIINDYLNVTHSFYEKNEVSLINGLLDSVHKSL